MRLLIELENQTTTEIPINYQEYLTAAVYGMLERSDADYARFLHDEGYRSGPAGKVFKLFTYSRLQSSRRRIEGDQLRFGPGPITWQVCSPIGDFLQNFANGLLQHGRLRVGTAQFRIASAQAVPEPAVGESARFICLSPIVASEPMEDGGARYLTPAEGERFSELIRRNLIRKYETVHGKPPEDDRFEMTFDAEYLRRRPGTALTTFKDVQVRGAFAPFEARGAAELLTMMLSAGAGSRNAMGHGMVEVAGIKEISNKA